MPEGDSIRSIANALAPLVGQILERVTTQGIVRDLAGRTITSVEPHGKHLMIDLDDQTQLRMHLGMNGSVRLYDRPRGEEIVGRMSPGRASLVLATPSLVAIWITAPTVEITSRRAPMRGVAVGALGPDVLAADFDPAVAAERAVVHASERIGLVLLDQRVAAGIGNIWKSESLHACGIDPRTPVADLTMTTLVEIYSAARRLMLASVTSTAGRASRDRFAVYSRTNLPCPRCASPISAFQLGDPPRWTWSCPRCQPPGAIAADTR